MQTLQSYLTSNSQLELLAKLLVNGFLIGLNKSPYHGFSVEFAEHAAYHQGDHIKHIDWKLFGRTEKLFTKRYEEETNLRCYFVIDDSASMRYPLHQFPNKQQLAYTCIACLLELLKRQRDAAALIRLNSEQSWTSACKSSVRHYRYLFQELDAHWQDNSLGQRSNWHQEWPHIIEQIPQRSLVVVVSDFVDDQWDANDWKEALQMTAFKKQEVLFVNPYHDSTEAMFNIGDEPLEVIDVESGQLLKLHPDDVRVNFRNNYKDKVNKINELCTLYEVDYLRFSELESMYLVLMRFLKRRQKMA
jgi:hypothetical protein